MLIAKLSPLETERVQNAAKEGKLLQRSSEVIHGGESFKAFADRQVLFTVNRVEAFDSLLDQATELYSKTVKKIQEEKEKEARRARRKPKENDTSDDKEEED